jgi:hypothetical protein
MSNELVPGVSASLTWVVEDRHRTRRGESKTKEGSLR